MSRCLYGREIVLAIRRRRGCEPEMARLVIPSRWSRSALLRYARSEHPGETVKIAEWHPVGGPDDPFGVRYWMPDPEGFAHYPTGVL